MHKIKLHTINWINIDDLIKLVKQDLNLEYQDAEHMVFTAFPADDTIIDPAYLDGNLLAHKAWPELTTVLSVIKKYYPEWLDSLMEVQVRG